MSISKNDDTIQTKHIVLTGFSGAGKSTIGPELATKLKRSFVDTDAQIVEQVGLSIKDIFEQKGERAFREIETEVITTNLCSKDKAVIALGGGALLAHANRDLVAEHGILVYLNCSIEELCLRLEKTNDRPLISHDQSDSHSDAESLREKVESRLLEREPSYRSADITVSTTEKSIDEVVREICHRLEEI